MFPGPFTNVTHEVSSKKETSCCIIKTSLIEFLMKNFPLGNTCRLFSPTVVCFYCMWSNTIKEKSLTNLVIVAFHYDFSDVELRLHDH